ncbi:DUF2971 domain-containing protein [Salmonella enterica]|jgi:hypothetical protein|uniref:DUF2971 domain-containing protein n=1 Tax=Enterobacteriaceae TaxID=543 RepID=UPI000D57036F|nr:MULTISPECIES: DUF2971 domain-containing protein [Enterobacteriaceae]EAZ7286628.1 DUF2971 domain-containing protein [Salmonella enterica]EBX8161988.1 DUF2971 domain-containing protein [Salmonella enterica subsp. enterica serovar Heidelberg]EDR4482727.1 DUF2971 domain-containing protein [Salmonella enterica subsp. enterica]EEL4625210.1 DUF2971 domain-containing protein [Salmonella enterica subsp. enterica serovar Enteritidis]MBJ8826435.1 DUF2971 domain-containing protein [Citrobacter freundii
MLYKYVGSSNPEDTINYLKYFLEDGTIRASDPFTFNDPSEFKIDLDLRADKDTARKRFIKDRPNDTHFESWFRGLEQAKWSIITDSRQQIMSMYGVICLTPKPDNYLMWSHYAASHTGFCIGFDEKFLETIEDIELAGYVNYSDDVPVFSFFSEKPEDFSDKIVFSKHTCWAYEVEYRAVTSSQGIKKFDKSHIKEVILGSHVPYEVEQYVRNFLDSNIKIYKMASPFNTYSLKKVEVTSDVFF